MVKNANCANVYVLPCVVGSKSIATYTCILYTMYVYTYVIYIHVCFTYVLATRIDLMAMKTFLDYCEQGLSSVGLSSAEKINGWEHFFATNENKKHVFT